MVYISRRQVAPVACYCYYLLLLSLLGVGIHCLAFFFFFFCYVQCKMIVAICRYENWLFDLHPRLSTSSVDTLAKQASCTSYVHSPNNLCYLLSSFISLHNVSIHI